MRFKEKNKVGKFLLNFHSL